MLNAIGMAFVQKMENYMLAPSKVSITVIIGIEPLGCAVKKPGRRYMFVFTYKSGHQKKFAQCRVGCEFFSPHAKWAAKNIIHKKSFDSPPPTGHKK